MSAVDFRRDVRRVPDPAGDRTLVVLDGTFLRYEWSGPSAEGRAAFAGRCRDRVSASRVTPGTWRHVQVLYAPGQLRRHGGAWWKSPG